MIDHSAPPAVCQNCGFDHVDAGCSEYRSVVTDDDVGRAIRTYNEWPDDVPLSPESVRRDAGALRLRRVLEDFASRHTPTASYCGCGHLWREHEVGERGDVVCRMNCPCTHDLRPESAADEKLSRALDWLETVAVHSGRLLQTIDTDPYTAAGIAAARAEVKRLYALRGRLQKEGSR